MKRIACIIGARPQFIKHFPLEIELSKAFDLITIHTGQHYDENMSQVFFNELGINRPDYIFSLREKSHARQTAEMLIQIEDILIKEEIDYVIVYGDTNSTLAGALSAAKLNIPIVHIEAGLRSFNRAMPEEINRILTDHMSSLLFCSSELGFQNLKNEGIHDGIFVSGDLMKDALFLLKDKVSNSMNTEYYLATLHRPYNTDDFGRLVKILEYLNNLDKNVLFPLHPRTRQILQERSFDLSKMRNISFVAPVGYLEMISLLKFSSRVYTDSGGLQKEAYWLKKQCITIRSETEWKETLVGGWNNLVYDNFDNLNQIPSVDLNSHQFNLYGDSHSAAQIVNELVRLLK